MRRYRKYLISQLLRRISCKFYTDTLFVNQKYIVGNTSAQIIPDGEGFIYVHSMRSKSQAREALNVVTREIGVSNTLISDNAWIRRYRRQNYRNVYVAVALMVGQQNHTFLGRTEPMI